MSAIAILPAISFSLATAAALFFEASPLAALVTHNGNATNSGLELRILAPFLPLATLMTITMAGIRVWSIKQYVILQNLLVPMGRPLLVGIFVALGLTPLLGAIAFSVPIAVGAVMGTALLFRQFKKPILGRSSQDKSPGSDRWPIFVSFWRFSGLRSLGGVFAIFLTWFDVVLLGILGSNKEVAAYTVASRYVVLGIFASSSMAIALAPQLGRLWAARRKSAIHALYLESTWWIMGIAWPILLMMAIFAPLLMSIVGKTYATGATRCRFLRVAMLTNTGTGNNGVTVLMLGRTKTILLIDATAMIVNVALNVELIPRYGAEGAAVAWSASILLSALIASVVLYRIAGIHPFGTGYMVVAVSAVASYGIVGVGFRWALGATWIAGAMAAVLGSASYLYLIGNIAIQGLDKSTRLSDPN